MRNDFIRGVMFDLARVIERHSYYRKMLSLLSEWGYNTLFLHLTDDQGCALEFKSMPEIVTPHAFSQNEMRDFVKEASRYNITVVPEIESLGHTEYITRLSKYRHLYEKLPGKYMYSAICPTRDESVSIFEKLYAEAADIFPSDFIHVGLDEVSFGACAKCCNALKKKERWEVLVDYIGRLHTITTRLGKQMIMWGDQILKEKGIARRISKDIIICDWHYDPEVQSESVEFFTKKGFKVICVPTLIFGNAQTIIPNTKNLANIQSFSEIAWRYKKKGVIGLLNTVWEPFRYLQGTINYGLALSGHLFSNKGKEDKLFGYDFLENYFGVKDNLKLLNAIRRLHQINPSRPFVRKAAFRTFKEIRIITEEEMVEGKELAELSGEIMNILKNERGKITLHVREYDELILAADIICTLGVRLSNLGKVMKLQKKAKEEIFAVVPVMRELARQGHRIHKLAVRNWNSTRYPDDKKRDKIILSPWGFDDGLTARLGISARLLDRFQKKIKDFFK